MRHIRVTKTITRLYSVVESTVNNIDVGMLLTDETVFELWYTLGVPVLINE